MQACTLFWDAFTFTLNLEIDESKLCCSVVRDDNDLIASLKRARLLFDEVYPDGPPTCVLMCSDKMAKKSQNMKQMKSQSTNSRQASRQSAKLISVITHTLESNLMLHQAICQIHHKHQYDSQLSQ